MIVVFRNQPEDGWTVHKCKLSGRFDLDAYSACYQARRYARDGACEVQVLDDGVVFARFTRSTTGVVTQEGGVEL